MNVLTINNVSIGNIDGFYSLSDLHKASGGLDKNKPSNFVRLEQTRALINELKCSHLSILPIISSKGRNGGTYVCKELVVAYAAWISPAFHLKVIRVFLNSQLSGEMFNYPIDTIKPKKLVGKTIWLTPANLLSTRRIDLELLKGIQKHGYDISAVIERVEAMYSAMEYYEEMRDRMTKFKHQLEYQLSTFKPERTHGRRVEF